MTTEPIELSILKKLYKLKDIFLPFLPVQSNIESLDASSASLVINLYFTKSLIFQLIDDSQLPNFISERGREPDNN